MTSNLTIALDAMGGDLGPSIVIPGAELAAPIERLLALPDAAYLHAHYAGRGCYAARIDHAIQV